MSDMELIQAKVIMFYIKLVKINLPDLPVFLVFPFYLLIFNILLIRDNNEIYANNIQFFLN